MPAPGTGTGRPFVRLAGITRRYGPLVANHDISFDIHAGTIHGLIGENGAGKSTLMKILYGLERPDAGRILIDGDPVAFRGPRDALARGIGMVHQHFMLIPTLSVLDNIILGDEPGRGFVLRRSEARERLLARAGHAVAGLDLRRPVSDLSVGEQQRVEILKLLYREARLLILDEPTAVLSPGEIRVLLADLRALARGGRTIVLISHHMAEILDVTDTVSVLRQGRLVATHPTREMTAARLAEEIIGETAGPDAPQRGILAGSAPAGAPVPPGARPPLEPAVPRGGVVLRFEEVVAPGESGRGGLNGVSLTLCAGEIVAIAGVEGNGQAELARVAAGRLVPRSGTLVRDGVRVPAGRAAPGAPERTGYIPEDRQRDGLILNMDAAENALLGRQRQARFRRGPRIHRRALLDHCRRLMEAHDVRPPEPEALAGSLSGGNQQKLVVAREVDESPGLLVASHPTRGLDLKAAAHVHAELRARRDAGAAVLLVTADLDEARALGDRLVVLFQGRIAGDVSPRHVSDEDLGLLMTGGTRS